MFYIYVFFIHLKKEKKQNKKYIGVNEMLNNLLYENYLQFTV